jgi:hypothetical protein
MIGGSWLDLLGSLDLNGEDKIAGMQKNPDRI